MVGDSDYFDIKQIRPVYDGFVWQTRVTSIGGAQLVSYMCALSWFPVTLLLPGVAWPPGLSYSMDLP